MYSTQTERELVLLLPQLKPDCDIKAGDRAGQWDLQPNQAFAKVASSLDYQAPGTVKSIGAVPTMWARPLLMEMALHLPSHPLRGQAIPQWQGMLAALALAEVRSFPLKAELLELKALQNEAFANCLVELLPDPVNALYTLDNKHPWVDVYVFLWDEKPVGMSSPSTLVVPSEQGIWKDLPWWDPKNKVLQSPQKFLNPSEQSLLWRWLENLHNALYQYPHPGERQAIDTMGGLVEEFRASLNSNPDLPLRLSDNEHFFGVSLNRGVLEALNRPVRAEEKESNVRLIPSRDKAATVPPLLIVDPEIATAWNVPPQNLWVYRGQTLASLKAEDLKSGRFIWPEVRWIEPKDLFLPELVFIDQEEALPGGFLPRETEPLTFKGQEITPLIPLNSILLDYFTPEDLLEKVQFQPFKGSEGSFVRLFLDLPLSGAEEGSSKNYRLYKDYPLKEENAIKETPVLEIWPHFRANGWQEYYTFYYDGGEETFQVNLPLVQEVQSFQEEGGVYQMARLEAFPEYIQCQDRQRNPIGLIVLPTPEEIQLRSSWQVGVDFGTSFTNIYINRNGASEPEPLQLETLKFQVTEHPKDTRLPVLFEYFIPDSFIPLERPLPLSSVLTTRGSELTDEESKRPVFDGRIYIPDRPFKPQEEWIKTELKWSTDNLKFNRLFLKHLALHISALAAKNGIDKIQWSLSYPSAFSRKDRNRYARVWQDLTEELQAVTGIGQSCPDAASTNYFRTESLAAAQYFRDQEGHRLVRTTCIDMGGGTSDISIWEENKPIHQCSVQLAGRNLFSHFLELNPQFLVRHFEVDPAEWQGLRGGRFNAKLDVWLRLDGNNWLKKRRAIVEQEENFQGFLKLVAIGTAGLYYYVGILLKVLHQEGKYNREEITEVYIGGNGSRLLNWLAETGQFDRNSEINLLLSRMLSRGSGFEDTEVTTRLSKNPKDEVACGLVWNQTQLADLPRQDSLISGEACQVNGELIYEYSRLKCDEEDIATFAIPQLVQLPQFLDEFHGALKELEIESIEPLSEYKRSSDTKLKDKLWREVRDELTNLVLDLRGNSDDIRLEPPFILGLKALLRVLGKQWAGQ